MIQTNKCPIILVAAAVFFLRLFGLGGGERPAVAYSEDGVLYLLTETGSLAKTIRTSLPIRDFAVSLDAERIIFNAASRTAYGGSLYLLTVSSGEVKPLTARSKNGEPVFSDPEFSSNGSRVVVALHGSAHGDLVEGSGPVGILGSDTGRLSVLGATTKIDGDGPAFSNEPHWSPNDSSVLFSFETGAAIVDSKGERLRELTSQMEDSGQEWSHAVGWLGSQCVVYIAGKSQKDANQRPARVLNLRTGTTSPAAQVLGVADSSLIGLIAFSPSIWIRAAGNKLIAETSTGTWEIPAHSTRNVIAKLVPEGESAAVGVPDSCR